jgi:hypothetical protein
METKMCSKCGNEKEINEFPFKNKEKNIRHIVCKFCWKEIRKKSYNNNKEVTLKRNKRNKKKNLEWYVNYKSKLKCVNCGEDHPACLEFHHIDPNKKDFNISINIRSTYSVNKILREIEKCDILCANCHRKLHYEMRDNKK